MLLTLVTVLYPRSLDFFIQHNYNLLPLTNISPFPLLPTPGNHLSTNKCVEIDEHNIVPDPDKNTKWLQPVTQDLS